ncbi:hypothetical protein [Corynebacterium ulcerans]|uniref:hypothetical protein n=1 Tax=Corynebacterium ulcerans TaxID=65058 RepID=UPI0018D89243|nr:hypothetical protein [Corynebacterium ulcerans]MBH5297513.1 hypothetical protein [Corynebacterium ulcerans]
MHLVPNTGTEHATTRRATPDWVKVAETALWGDRVDAALSGENMVEPYGALAVRCLRTPSTDLTTARFMLELQCGKDKPVLVDCSQDDLIHLAQKLLDAAMHAVPLELQHAGYEHAVMPWFDGDDSNGGGAA